MQLAAAAAAAGDARRHGRVPLVSCPNLVPPYATLLLVPLPPPPPATHPPHTHLPQVSQLVVPLSFLEAKGARGALRRTAQVFPCLSRVTLVRSLGWCDPVQVGEGGGEEGWEVCRVVVSIALGRCAYVCVGGWGTGLTGGWGAMEARCGSFTSRFHAYLRLTPLMALPLPHIAAHHTHKHTQPTRPCHHPSLTPAFPPPKHNAHTHTRRAWTWSPWCAWCPAPPRWSR